MKREVIVDTETTGLNPNISRIVEIGCVEIIDLKKTGRHYRVLINPECDIPQVTIDVHGITNDMVKDAPKFKDIAEEFLNFVKDSNIVIHNAKFDTEMLDMEFKKIGMPSIFQQVRDVKCTLELDKRLFEKEKKHKLDVICDRLGIDRSHRTLHGALIDCDLLADVYIKYHEIFPPEVMEADIEQKFWTRPEVKRYNDILPSATLSDIEENSHNEFLQGIEKTDKVVPIFKKSGNKLTM